jgi:acyl-CoA synthetase (AMP-forming)/AMP-acid ligase II
MTPDVMYARAEGGGDSPALVGPDGASIATFAELCAAAQVARAHLGALGAGAGVPVAWLGRNGAAFLAGQQAAAWLGAPFVPLAVTSDDDRIAAILADLARAFDAVVLVHEARRRDAARRGCDAVAARGVAPPRLVDAGALAAPVRPLDAPPAGDVGTAILYTSGTSGEPKGCVRPPAAERARLEWVARVVALTADDVHLAVNFMSHSAPGHFARAHLRAGARVALLGEAFDAPRFVAAAAASGATNTFLVPTQVRALAALPASERRGLAHTRLARVVVAGERFPPELKRDLPALFDALSFVEFYGSTETGTVTEHTPEDSPDWCESVGRPSPEARVCVDDDGLIRVDAPWRMSGYLGHPPATGAITVHDVGLLRGGALYHRGRLGDMFIVAGENVYPAEVERVLAAARGVAEVAVFGVDDAAAGRTVAVAVVVGAATRAELDAAMDAHHLARHQRPVHVATVASLPKNANGKVLRGDLARAFLAGRLDATP